MRGREELELPTNRYLIALVRLRNRISDGLELGLSDSDAIGDSGECVSWGLCSRSKVTWPDAEDHLWPDEFLEGGRVSPKYGKIGDVCPFDDTSREDGLTPPPWGCYYRCRILRPKKGESRPDRKVALEMYDDVIRRVIGRETRSYVTEGESRAGKE